MAKAAFEVTYDGPVLADGQMPVRELAPALLALGELFAEAGVSLYPDQDPVALNVKATNEGSFEVHLILEAAGAWDQVVDLFSSDSATALANLIAYVAGGVGLVEIVRRIAGRRIVNSDEVEPGQIKLTLDDGDTLEVPTQVLNLYRNVRVRKAARQVVEPLRRPGVDRLDLRSEREIAVSVDSSEVSAFDVPELEEEPLLETERQMVLSIASITFVEGNKWRFSDGEIRFYATVEDVDFLDRVERGVASFRKGDLLKCRVRISQSQQDDALHTEYFVAEVLEHIPRATQLPLGGEGIDLDD